MKTFTFSVGVLLSWAMCDLVSGQAAKAFPDGRLLPEGQNRPVMLDVEGSLAVMVLPTGGGEPVATAWERSGGSWSQTYEFGAFPYTCVSVSPPYIAVGYPGRITIYERINATKYVLLTGPPVDADEIPRKIDMEGTRIAAIVQKPSWATPSGRFARVYDNSGGAWNLTRELEILATGGVIIGGGSSVISDIDLEGDRLAVAGSSENVIEIHERNQGGVDAWETVATIDGDPANWDQLGLSVALSGDRLASSLLDGVAGEVQGFSRNQGGTNAWGNTGSLIAATPSGPGFIQLAADPATGRLAALGISPLTLAGTPGASTLTVFATSAGAWTAEHAGPAGPVRALGFAPPDLAISGDDMLHGLGDSTPTSSSWEVSVHRRGTGGATAWGLAQSLSGPDAPVGFGSVVAARGPLVAVGMPDESAAGSQSGAVMVWWQIPVAGGSTWQPVGRFEAPLPAAGQRFGASLSIIAADSGNSAFWLAVGAPGENSGRGAVYLHLVRIIGGIQDPIRIAPAGLDADDAFGASVSLAGEARLAVGAPGDDDFGADAGAVYVFEDDLGGAMTWGQRAKRLMPAGETGGGFGTAVAMTANHFAASRPAAGVPGKVFLYERSTGGSDNWGHLSTLAAPAGAPAGFPSSVAASPEIPLFGIGATASSGNGRAYLYGYDSSGSGWLQLFATTGSAGEGPTFGSSIAASLGRLVVGAPGTGSGGAVFTYGVLSTAFVFEHYHTDSGAPGEAAGTAVAADTIHSYIGLPGASDRGPGTGAVAIVRSGSYEIWAAAQGPAFTQWLPSQDPDSDGVENLTEFGLGGNPMSASSRPAFAMNRTTYHNGATSWPALEWSPPSLPYSTSLLHYRMQAGTDLSIWANTSPDGGVGLGEPPGRFYRIDLPREFFRLDLRYPEETPSGGGIIGIE